MELGSLGGGTGPLMPKSPSGVDSIVKTFPGQGWLIDSVSKSPRFLFYTVERTGRILRYGEIIALKSTTVFDALDEVSFYLEG
jgi:hypothetical protein